MGCGHIHRACSAGILAGFVPTSRASRLKCWCSGSYVLVSLVCGLGAVSNEDEDEDEDEHEW